MATVLFSVAGAAIGGSVGGTLAGLSSVAIGRAVGATLGRVIDQRLLGQGGQAIETGKVDRFRITSAGEGDPIAQVYGRMRLGGHVIWASDFQETTQTTGGGKGSRSQPTTTEYSYSVSLAIALCEGEVTRIGRVWADGEEVARGGLNMRVYTGSSDQLPDPVMEAVEGAGRVPAYRGTAYVVLEDLDLAPFGNRIPQFSFEVLRPEQPEAPDRAYTPAFGIEGVALIPGTGEYALATTAVNIAAETGVFKSANVSTPAGKPDFAVATEAMNEELPNLKAASLVVSWFGDDLRCGECTIRPKVENTFQEGENMPWVSSGLTRGNAQVIVQDEAGRPIYGGTPTDTSVIEAIQSLNEAGNAVMFYPFILMDQFTENGLPDPYSDAPHQPRLPWRGRITLSKAPGQPDSPDGTTLAAEQVAAFFGTATAASFALEDGQVVFLDGQGSAGADGGEDSEAGEGEDTGEVVYQDNPADWSFSRFILHNAMLCAAAGGIEAFCIGSEMRGLTQIRGAGGVFIAVQHLVALAAEVRSILGPDTKISYAADWSEYFGHQPQDGTGDRYFHLDPLWADPNIDFIGIDNYMPLADWRDKPGHLDAEAWNSMYDLDYLKSNIEGGEGYDWYYHSAEARDAQIRTEISDGAHLEPWVYRYKDIRGWWENFHHERINGVRQASATAWEPMSKPIWFTEYGCAAINKGANQPNKFLDRKSSESKLPYYSSGARDELMQMQYLRAVISYWDDPAHNPLSTEYEGRMLDMRRAYVWAFDTRPYPFFPNNIEKWSDGDNYTRGHWINGRTAGRSLASVVSEICRRAGLEAFSTDGLYGYVRGYAVEQVTEARSALQPLMIRYGFDAIERGGVLQFRMRDGLEPVTLDPALLAVSDELEGTTEQVREAEAEVSGRMRLRFVQADADFEVIAEEAVLADEATHAVAGSEVNMALTRGEGRQVAERWLTEARVSRDTVRLALPPSQLGLGAGDVIEVPGDKEERAALYRIDRVEKSDLQLIEAVRIEPQVYDVADIFDNLVKARQFVAPTPVVSHFLDLPLLRGDEVAHAPHIAATAQPWPGPVALYQSSMDANYQINKIIGSRATMGVTRSAMPFARAGVLDRGEVLEVALINGTLSSVSEDALLSGANMAAIGDGSSDQWEIFQFAQAELVGPQTYWLKTRLRGQAGSDGLMPGVWPAGSKFVLLDGVPEQIELSPNLRRVAQNFRIGPAKRSNDDPSYGHLVEAFDGNGLRPYSPCHLRGSKLANGDVALSWIRRTRIDGDGWDGPEVPLGEENESYVVRIGQGATVVRETLVAAAQWEYTTGMQVEDGIAGPFDVAVAQVSASYGAGLFGQLRIG
ncbi:host specificity protein [Sulfitobacter sp. M57]|uniref:baseplate multidomain protein megatron n=1 Tax=unclassified Sulfitobacter TaxID=196795 RepID=UPI0023E34604|nr:MULTISPECIES: glycoside hydrolase/phage tail family protein [unclassified Sulfitobacter]MDF3413450.1 host specificity protein [Sulfitobacter sp. KE5]MDF3421270.1 host specificity protein [Sulfitobacter sp. KE43]MDF3431997.1 host specificity protein [Sulfitobacter sp. KE42]MDF3457637.1 host specificity protein [Sulfitobacter sp. S74]MDF3461539.1 host specificity protein [Sulfitobacter sp. Ks18]